MDLSKLKPEYEAHVYQVSIKFPPFTFGSNRVIGYYEDESLAHRVWTVFHNHFMCRINGGVDVFSNEYYVRVEKISGTWHLIDDPGKTIETSYNHEKIQACIDSLTKYAKEIKIKVIDGDGNESFEGIYIDRKRKAEQQLEPKTDAEGHEAKLYELGFDSFKTRKELQKAYKVWSLKNHPDKKPEAERGEADARFKNMRIHYDAVLEAKQWPS